jgi:hypothetical protein
MENLDVKTLPWATDVAFTDEDNGEKFSTLDNGMILSDMSIGDPAARTHGVTIPGKDGVLDLTEALGGIYYENRTVELDFRIIDYTEKLFHLTSSKMRNALDGRKMKIILGDDPDHYWMGRCAVDVDRSGRYVSIVKVTVDADPYKYNVLSSYDPWEWDRFSFVDGVITQEADVTLTGSVKTVKLPVDPTRCKLVLWLNTGTAKARLSTDATWHTLASGSNSFPEIRLSNISESTLYLDGTGSVGIAYRIGSL